ncbi:hypothetical protein BUE80_DR001397 [Diplocarpon rosae]|nr:hypothetical protein BUE80_DR001397 [Diplocarpon rosae]
MAIQAGTYLDKYCTSSVVDLTGGDYCPNGLSAHCCVDDSKGESSTYPNFHTCHYLNDAWGDDVSRDCNNGEGRIFCA